MGIIKQRTHHHSPSPTPNHFHPSPTTRAPTIIAHPPPPTQNNTPPTFTSPNNAHPPPPTQSKTLSTPPTQNNGPLTPTHHTYPKQCSIHHHFTKLMSHPPKIIHTHSKQSPFYPHAPLPTQNNAPYIPTFPK